MRVYRIKIYCLILLSLFACKTLVHRSAQDITENDESTSIYLAPDETSVALGLVMAVDEIADTHHFSNITKEQHFQAFYGDSQWYKDFQQQSPEAKRKILENEINIVKKLNGARKLKLVIVWVGGGSGHKSAKDAILEVFDKNPELKNIFEVSEYKISTPFQIVMDKRWEKYMREGDGEALKRMMMGLDPYIDFKYIQSLFHNDLEHDAKGIIEAAKGNPDFILSVHNIRSLAYLNALGKKLGSEMSLLATDFDARHFFKGDSSEFVKTYIPADMGENSKLTKKMDQKKVRYDVTGYSLRYAFLEQGERLHSSDPEKRRMAEESIESFFKERELNLDQDLSVFLMLGGTGTKESIVKSYINNIHSHAPEFLEAANKDGTLHMFVACTAEQVENLSKMQVNNSHFRLHILGRVGAPDIAKYMNKSLNIVKPGGGTVGELVATEAKAFFDMTLSAYLPWEKAHAKWFESQHWGKKAPPLSQKEEFKKAFIELIKMKPNPYPENHFHLDWIAQQLYSAKARLAVEQNISLKKIDEAFGEDLKPKSVSFNVFENDKETAPGPNEYIYEEINEQRILAN